MEAETSQIGTMAPGLPLQCLPLCRRFDFASAMRAASIRCGRSGDHGCDKGAGPRAPDVRGNFGAFRRLFAWPNLVHPMDQAVRAHHDRGGFFRSTRIVRANSHAHRNNLADNEGKRRGARGMSRWDSDAAARNRHAHRGWTSTNEEGRLRLRPLDARTRAHARLHLRRRRGRLLCTYVGLDPGKEDHLEKAIASATVDEFVRLVY